MTSKVLAAWVYARWLRAWTRLLFWRSSPGDVKIIAHRGASHLAPENTLASARLAWEQGADAVEVDVHLTRDNRIVALHDPTTGRTAGSELVVATTNSSDLCRLDVGSHKHPEFCGERIPLLEDVLDTVPPGRQLFIEVKCGPAILPLLNETIGRSGKRSQMVLIGFDLATMKAAKEVMPDVPVYWLCDKKLLGPRNHLLAVTAKANGLDGLNVHWLGVTWRFAKAVRKAGLKLYVWTVDDPADAARLRMIGVDGITTNCPDRIREALAASPVHRTDDDMSRAPGSACL